MGRIYTTEGTKMNTEMVCSELLATLKTEDKSRIAKSLKTYESFDNSHMRLAHAVLDVYKSFDMSTEYGARMRKLLDHLMNKYQKSKDTSSDDQSSYHRLICDITAE